MQPPKILGDLVQPDPFVIGSYAVSTVSSVVTMMGMVRALWQKLEDEDRGEAARSA